MRNNIGAGAWLGLGVLVLGGAAIAADPADSNARLGTSIATDREGAATANYGATTIERKTAEGAKNDAKADAPMVAKLHHINKMEIDAGTLARDKGSTRGVREYGARLVRDHQEADAQLVAYANKNGMDPNAMPPPGTDDEAKDADHMAHLRTLTGLAFDRELVTMMADGHAKAIGFVQTCRTTVRDPALRNMLNGWLPTLEKHEQIARSLLPNGRS